MKLNIILASAVALAFAGQAFGATPAAPAAADDAAVTTPADASVNSANTLLPFYIAGGVAIVGAVAIASDNHNSHHAGSPGSGTGGTGGTGGTTGTTGTH